MTGQSHWIALVPIVFGVIGIAWLLWSDRIAERHYEIEQRRFLCPILRQKVVAKLVRDAQSGRVIGVRSCSAFSDPETVACPKQCVPGFGGAQARQQVGVS
jgi:hypothetical protein